MPIGTADIPKALQTTMRVEFLKALDGLPRDDSWRDFTMEVQSTADTETYGWLGQLPGMREFIGEREVRDLTETGKTLKNKTWEMTIGVKRAAWEDDKVGAIASKVQQMAANYQSWLAEQAYTCLILGHLTDATNPYGEAFDDAAFYADAHTLGVSTIDNNGGNVAITAADVKAGIGVMKAYKGDLGRNLRVDPTHLIVAPLLEFTAAELVTMAPGATSGQALWGRLQLQSPPEFADDSVARTGGNTRCWALVDCSQAVKPIIFQRRTELEFTSLQADSDVGFMRDEYLFGVRSRCAFGYGAYWLALLYRVA